MYMSTSKEPVNVERRIDVCALTLYRPHVPHVCLYIYFVKAAHLKYVYMPLSFSGNAVGGDLLLYLYQIRVQSVL